MSDPQSLAGAGVAPIIVPVPSSSGATDSSSLGSSHDKVAQASSTFDSGFLSSESVGGFTSEEQTDDQTAADKHEPIASSASAAKDADEKTRTTSSFVDSGLCETSCEQTDEAEQQLSSGSGMHLDKHSAAKEWTCSGPLPADGQNNLSEQTSATTTTAAKANPRNVAASTGPVDMAKIKQYQSLWKIIFLQNDDNGDTQLHLAIVGKMPKATLNIIRLAPHSELLDMINDDGQTGMHCAVLTGQPNVIRQLRAAGAKPSIRDFDGNTPLHLACLNGDAACVEALTAPITVDEQLTFPYAQRIPLLPADTNQLNYEGEYCVHIAARLGNVAILRLLARCCDIDLNAREACGGYTALHIASESGDAVTQQFLLARCRHQLQLETCSYGRLTAYQMAATAEQRAALRDSGARPLAAPVDSDDDDDSASDSDDDGRRRDGSDSDSDDGNDNEKVVARQFEQVPRGVAALVQ